jgi:hypothetical protein
MEHLVAEKRRDMKMREGLGRADVAEELVDVRAQVDRLLAQLIGRGQHLV